MRRRDFIAFVCGTAARGRRLAFAQAKADNAKRNRIHRQCAASAGQEKLP